MQKRNTQLIVVVALSLLIASFSSGAASDKEEIRAGGEYEKQGQFFRAASAYSMSLRLNPGNSKGRRALERVADPAIEEKLRSAEALEAGLQADEAIAELDSAARFRDRLAELTIESRQARGIEARREELVSRRVQALLDEAENASANGMWSAGIAHLNRVQVLRPGSEDTHNRLYDMWTSWSDTNIDEGRLRAAAERYEQAARIPGARSRVAASRAAAIRVALGKSALGKGACRASVSELRTAEKLAPGSVVPELLGQATSCAATCVRLSISADADAGVAKEQLRLLEPEMRRRAREGASEFLRLHSPGPLEIQTCDARRMPGIDGAPIETGPYDVSVRVTSVRIVRQPASSVTRQTRTSHGFGVETQGTYEEYRDTLTGTISGWITASDQRATGMSVPMPVRASGQATARWQGSQVSSITRENVFTGQRATAVAIEVAPRGKAQAESERQQARSDLTETLIRNFAAEAAKRLLSTLDIEPDVPDPTHLEMAQRLD